jgi:hypothetical protein
LLGEIQVSGFAIEGAFQVLLLDGGCDGHALRHARESRFTFPRCAVVAAA